MRVAIVFNHPDEGSYNNAILDAVTKGLQNANQEVDRMHLDNGGFNPSMSKAYLKAFVDNNPVDPQVIDYHERLKKSDHLIFIFSIWWNLMHAMTIQRVYRPGVEPGSRI